MKATRHGWHCTRPSWASFIRRAPRKCLGRCRRQRIWKGFSNACEARMDIKWDDTDPSTGRRRFVKADHFAGRWTFYCRRVRRGIWEKWANPSREMWQDLLEALERRVQ